MNERNLQIQVGIAFIAGIVILIAGVLWFKGYHFARKSKMVTVEFPSTSGLVSGDPIEVRGVRSGKVSKIGFDEGRAVVDLEMDKRIDLHHDAKFVIENVGIMGQKQVQVDPGRMGRAIPPDSLFFIGTYQPGIPEVVQSMSSTLDAVQRLSVRLDTLMAAFDNIGNASVTRTLNNMVSITDDLAKFLVDTRGELSGSIRNFNEAMGDMHQALGAQGPFNEFVRSATRTSTRLDSTLASLNSLSMRADSVMAQVEAGHGTVGSALRDDRLYHEMVGTVRETRALIEEIRRNPKKYLKISVF